MTQVHADNSHILCLFEDIQFHLSELGYPSSIRDGKLLYESPADLGGGHREFMCNGQEFWIYTMLANSYEGKRIVIPEPHASIVLFLEKLLPLYLDENARHEHAGE